jgi:hypothetical protein
VAVVVSPSNRPPRLPFLTNAIENLANISLEGRPLRSGKPNVHQKNLIGPSEAVKRDSIWMRAQELAQALFRNFAALRFEPASFLPTPNLSRRHEKHGCKSVDRENRGSVNLVRFVIKPRKLRPD